MEITLATIGTAGRKEDGNHLTRKHFEAACIVARGLIEQLNESNYTITTMVSGGAAYMDHIAVKLFLDKTVSNLRLFIPAEWNNGEFYDTGVKDTKENPGGTANYYHRKFQSTTNINGLSDIQIAKANGAELYKCRGGFHGRNAMVAKSDFILACTFGEGPIVNEGGTADTIRMYLERVRKEGIFDKSFHYNLADGKIYEGCKVPPPSEMDKARAAARQPWVQNIHPGAFAMHSYPPWLNRCLDF